MSISSVRLTPDNASVQRSLGKLAELAGSWRGKGFNLIARPDFHNQANLYLQLNQTRESLKIEAIGGSVPNRGFGQDDIELFGLTYLQKISDASTGGGLHIEPGIWVTQPATTYPVESAPGQEQIVTRMATIPHGNSVLAQGVTTTFEGPPTLTAAPQTYAFSTFPSFNSTPFATQPTAPPVINADGSSDKLTAPPPGFTQYDLSNPESVANPRTPFGTNPPEPALPAAILGVPMQDVVNDPIRLLQAVVQEQVHAGYTFEGVALNISTQSSITFFQNPNSHPGDPIVVVNPTNGAGGVENILFLEGGEPAGPVGSNALTALVYATFWIEKVSHPEYNSFMQLQYAQMTVLNFEIFKALPGAHINLGWPHISVANLRKSFE